MSKRVGVYLRVSTIGQTCDSQRDEILAFVKARGWIVAEVYEDKLSGLTDKRPALQKLFMDARARKLDVVATYKNDRLFRSLKNLILSIQELDELGIAYISIKDSIDLTTSQGRLLLHLLGSFSEFEASLIRTRVLSGLQAAKARGVILGRPKIINAQQVVELRAKGMSLSQIAKVIGCTKSGVSKTLKKAKA